MRLQFRASLSGFFFISEGEILRTLFFLVQFFPFVFFRPKRWSPFLKCRLLGMWHMAHKPIIPVFPLREPWLTPRPTFGCTQHVLFSTSHLFGLLNPTPRVFSRPACGSDGLVKSTTPWFPPPPFQAVPAGYSYFIPKPHRL